jgi:hypothetical protein
MAMKIQLSYGWEINATVDDDNHLNTYIHNIDGSDVLSIGNDQGAGKSGEDYAERYTTEQIEATYRKEEGIEDHRQDQLVDQAEPYQQLVQLIRDQQEFIATWKPYAGRDALAEMEALSVRAAELIETE